jgi:hypothetical protein
MIRRLGFLAAAAAALSLCWAGGATAATEFGSTCQADSAQPNLTLLQFGQAPENALPLTAPAGGVITRWSIDNLTGIAPGASPQALQVYRRDGALSFNLVAQTGETPLAAGLNTIPTRLPVQAGDRLGIHGATTTMYCDSESESDVIAFFEGSLQPGETQLFQLDKPFRIPVRAVIEPDADNDGFGDETQDACPQSAVLQVACPPVTLSTSTRVKKGSVTVIVTSSTAAPVTVKGVAKLGKGKKAKLNGGTQNLVPGTLTKFKLFFTKGLKNKLKEMKPSKKLTLKVTISGTSVSGAVTTNTLKLKLKGQAKT